MEDDNSIRQKVTKYLHETPHQKRYNVKVICKELGISLEYYKSNGQYLYNLINEYRTNYENEQGLKRLDIHNWRGFLYAPTTLTHEAAIKAGWVPRNARNRGVAIKVRDGRLEWFETGRVNVWVRKPVSDGRKFQVLADAFVKTELISDINAFATWARTLRQNGLHVPIEIAPKGEKLPYCKIIAFKKSNGVTIVLGDKSHPNAAEIQVSMPDWAERNEMALQSATNTIATLINSFSKQQENFAKQSEMFMAQQKQVAEILGGSTVAKPMEMRIYE